MRVIEHDLFTAFDPSLHGCADIVRIANVLNTNLLDGSQVRQIAVNLGSLCRDGSFIYACRSTKKGARASFFRLKKSQLELVASLNGGVDAEPLLANLSIAK